MEQTGWDLSGTNNNKLANIDKSPVTDLPRIQRMDKASSVTIKKDLFKRKIHTGPVKAVKQL